MMSEHYMTPDEVREALRLPEKPGWRRRTRAAIVRMRVPLVTVTSHHWIVPSDAFRRAIERQLVESRGGEQPEGLVRSA